MHFQHHAKPNVIDKDPDTRIEPVFVLGDKIPIRVTYIPSHSFIQPSISSTRLHTTMLNMVKAFPIIFNIYISSSVNARHRSLFCKLI